MCAGLSSRDVSRFVVFLQHARDARRRKQLDHGAIWLQAASYLFPVCADKIRELTMALTAEDRLDEAVSLAQLAAQLYPDDANAAFQLGYTLQMANRHAEAVASYRAVLAVQPDMPSLRNNLAMALRLTGGARAEILILLEAAIAANPHEIQAWINLMIEQRDQGNLAAALQAADRALALGPDHVLVLNNVALIFKEAQRWDEAERWARRAYELAPLDPVYQYNVAIMELMRDNADGWRGYEARWEGSRELSGKRPRLPGARWQGEPLAGKTLLVWGEQGMGDLLQFCRFIPQLSEFVHRQGGRLVWNSFPQMGELLVRSLGYYVDAFTAGGGVADLPPFDYELSLMSIPWMLGATDVSPRLASTSSYLYADQQAIQAWQNRLAEQSPRALKVGLAWTGSATHQRNQFRRVGLARCQAALAGIEGVRFYSLQPGAGDDVAAAHAAGWPIIDHTPMCRTFDDTAAMISALDLVITVCTSVAHLSGALGQHTWVLLDVNPHWPWQVSRADSPWYPRTTLYRQSTFQDWDPVMTALAQDLLALSTQRSALARTSA
ncbi:tetratricopeptide repeat protein [Burkholderia cepacia]|uniref:tetratricopeptide repeat protein n=1 Tax=Burkholderia cepacia TaxID=292 RepID=UPI00158E8B4D|nr:tetratricopeptide repeat protein [Burkholderia cepacia]